MCSLSTSLHFRSQSDKTCVWKYKNLLPLDQSWSSSSLLFTNTTLSFLASCFLLQHNNDVIGILHDVIKHMAATWIDIVQVLRICHTSRWLHATLQVPQRRLHYCRNHGSFGILAVKMKTTDWVHPPLIARSYAGMTSWPSVFDRQSFLASYSDSSVFVHKSKPGYKTRLSCHVESPTEG